ncbi:MAG: DUF3015 family protein [Nitrospira sp.]|nr:DUF3015 family protein [Nitrospira sp.]
MARMIDVTGVCGMVVVLASALSVSGCNTSKATVDTFAKFTSSTSPGEYFNADGLVTDSQKAQLFAAVAFENIEQNIARGDGEYLTSLVALMKIPAGEQAAFRARAQSQYPTLFASDGRTAERLLSALSGKENSTHSSGGTGSMEPVVTTAVVSR